MTSAPSRKVDAAPPEMLFQGEDIWVAARHAPSDTVVCTFAIFEGGGEHWAESQVTRSRKAGVFFGCKKDLWWQTPEMTLAARAAGAFAAGYDKRIGYSASMGAFGSLQWSNEIGLTEIVAVAPQTVISPGARLHSKWKIPAKIYRDDVRETLVLRPKIIFDPHTEIDAWQADQLEGRADRLIAPFAGHKALTPLREAGVLSAFMLMLLGGQLTAQSWRRLFRQSRRASTSYMAGLELRRTGGVRGSVGQGVE